MRGDHAPSGRCFECVDSCHQLIPLFLRWETISTSGTGIALVALRAFRAVRTSGACVALRTSGSGVAFRTFRSVRTSGTSGTLRSFRTRSQFDVSDSVLNMIQTGR